ncbi:MAG: Gfo/Idh/MocA family oxidoreductase [Ferruginibacter sp.]
MDRRNFIKSGAVVAGSLIMPSPLMASQDKLKLAILGTGWWGTDLLLANALASGQFEIVGLCDVNSVSLNRAADAVVKSGAKKPALFSSYKEMYEIPGLQAVAIATPTHWHALQFIDACKKGLHVFLEKPISYDIREGQAMLQAHRKAKNVVQVDFPRVMANTNDQVRSFIASGEAGKILQVQANINNPEGPLVEKEIPKTIDYETFCGPAPRKKFLCAGEGTNPFWRGQHDFSRGIMADWGIHYIHNARRVLNLDLPDSVSAIGGTVKNFTQDNPDHLDVRYDFGGLPVHWSHKTWGYASPDPDKNIGVYYYGEKATIFAGDLGWEVYPAKGGAKIVHGDVKFDPGNPKVFQTYLNMIIDLFKEFAEQVRKNSNDGITNTLEDAYKTTSTVIYGDMAYLVKSGFSIDKLTMNVNNNEEARKMLKREYRAPYRHPYTS